MKAILVARCNDGMSTLAELETLYEHDREISYRTFAKRVCIPSISEQLGYAHGRHGKGLRLSQSYAVRFYRSIFRDKPCWHLTWSMVDHIFQCEYIPPDNLL